jgi:hypothetical protein
MAKCTASSCTFQHRRRGRDRIDGRVHRAGGHIGVEPPHRVERAVRDVLVDGLASRIDEHDRNRPRPRLLQTLSQRVQFPGKHDRPVGSEQHVALVAKSGYGGVYVVGDAFAASASARTSSRPGASSCGRHNTVA